MTSTGHFAEQQVTLDESYLVQGLTGMARANGWFDAHWGAAVIAGYFLCKENKLDGATVEGIKSQLDAAIARRGQQFAPLKEESANVVLLEKIPQALLSAMEGGLREHGHAAIFASLSLKALRQMPELTQPTLVNALCNLIQQISRKPAEKPDSNTIAEYATTDEMIRALFDNLARFEPLLGLPSIRRPNFTHMTTHTEALLSLHEMGYEQIAAKGFLGHRVHVSAQLPKIDPSQTAKRTESTLEAIMANAFWENSSNLDQWNKQWNLHKNPNGDWIASGHLFKVLYSFHRLIGHIENKERIQLCSRILLERYFNPQVQGG